MGNYTIIIEAVGNHGCTRELGDGSTVFGCGRMSCPDCETRRFVELLKSQGNNVLEAKLIHWPVQGTQGQQLTQGAVTDDLLTKKRTGNFPK